ncbi:serine/threonine protein phosphatase [Methanocalculus chunghsingensis]|uniref:non-specific serine/threonine protein kinase n=1 Tax=Methanocalculus chunghsingensis TaxID=156457 RepID=A0A8J8B415_9EURY|nr:RIO1 family regulatory kinase/ATPase [Methanocalculus chunghsingensis]MBR1368830.1 serine/threonine protein phosphatase [Methanocalculus chunghsingensis]
MPPSADTVRDLHKFEYTILFAIERLMKRYAWVPFDDLKRVTRLSKNELEYRLGDLLHKDLVRYEGAPYPGYSLLFNGYDALALHTLTKRGSISALGSLIGVGKESEVFEALGLGVIVLKFHRVGQQSFQSVRLNREYMSKDGHCPWIFASASSAEQEYEALLRLNGKVRVPVPIDRSRHTIAMSYVPGVNLNQCTLEDPQYILDELMEEMKKIYALGIIHADFSEYNVMVNEDHCWIIDWPQWVSVTHPNADEILLHDVTTIVDFFNRKYRMSLQVSDALDQVTG